MRHTIVLTPALAATVTLLVSAAPPAEARISQGGKLETQVSRTVNLRDLDLSRPEDLVTLDRRILVAARHVCSNDRGRSLPERAKYLQCVREAQDKAWATLEPHLRYRSAAPFDPSSAAGSEALPCRRVGGAQGPDCP